MRKLNLKDSLVYTKDATLEEQLDAVSRIGEQCLFSDDPEFGNGKYMQAMLDRVDVGNAKYHYGAEDTLEYFCYMIPLSNAVFVDTEEPEELQIDKTGLRPLSSFDEFRELTGKGIGDVITIRSTNPEFDFMTTCLVLGTATKDGEEEIMLGNYSIPVEELFDEYAWDDQGTFKPFGIE